MASPNYYKALANVAVANNLFYNAPGFDRGWELDAGISGLAMMPLDKDNLYDPKAYFEDNLERIKSNSCSIAVFHPGFLDQDILDSSSFTLIRPMECDFLCSQWVKDFIDNNGIELVDFTSYRD